MKFWRTRNECATTGARPAERSGWRHVSLQEQPAVDRLRSFVVAAEERPFYAAGVEGIADRGEGDGSRALGWKAVDAGADGREGDGPHAVIAGELHAAAVAATELGVLCVLSGFAPSFHTPDRAD